MRHEDVIRLLNERGVQPRDIAEIVYALQLPYHPNLDLETCEKSVIHVLKKREVQNVLFTGITLDVLAEQRKLPEPLQTVMEKDDPLYGVDEILALGITNVYGSIGFTSFGFLDKEKTGIIAKLNNNTDRIHVFLDDLVAGIAAAASARIAHRKESGNGEDFDDRDV